MCKNSNIQLVSIRHHQSSHRNWKLLLLFLKNSIFVLFRAVVTKNDESEDGRTKWFYPIRLNCNALRLNVCCKSPTPDVQNWVLTIDREACMESTHAIMPVLSGHLASDDVMGFNIQRMLSPHTYFIQEQPNHHIRIEYILFALVIRYIYNSANEMVLVFKLSSTDCGHGMVCVCVWGVRGCVSAF